MVELVETTTPYEERDLEVAGDGAPTVAEYALVEFAAATGRSTTSGGLYLGDAVEVRHRLPRLWERVLAGQVAVWRARRVAQLTKSLPAEAAAYVDRHLTPVMGRCSWAQIDRTVEAARARFDPAETTRRAREAAEARGVDIRLGEAAITATATGTGTGTGTVGMEARLDLADALDLEDAVAQVAQDLLQTHPDLSLNARRAMALGIIARGEAGGWTHRRLTQTTFEWTSPHGRTYRVTSDRHIR